MDKGDQSPDKERVKIEKWETGKRKQSAKSRVKTSSFIIHY